MVVGPTFYVILTAFFFLLFLVVAILLEKRKKPIQTFPGKKIPLLMKVNRDTVIKGLAAAGFILFSRKLIYYIPLDGFIQTKFSIWWVEGKAQSLLFISIFVLFVIALGYQMLLKDIEEEGCGMILVGVSIMAILIYIVMKALSADLKFEFPITGRHLISIIFAPLVLLKMLLSGEYLGLLTGFLLGYLLVAGYKKLTPGISKRHVKIMIAAVLMFLIFLGFSFYKSLGNLGNWEQRLNNKVLSVSGESDMMDLLDAVRTIYQDKAQYEILENIVWLIVKEGDSRWEKELYQRVVEEVKTLSGSRSSRLLRKIVLWIAKTGDISWAVEVAMSIPAKDIRNNVLKELREKRGEK